MISILIISVNTVSILTISRAIRRCWTIRPEPRAVTRPNSSMDRPARRVSRCSLACLRKGSSSGQGDRPSISQQAAVVHFATAKLLPGSLTCGDRSQTKCRGAASWRSASFWIARASLPPRPSRRAPSSSPARSPRCDPVRLARACATTGPHDRCGASAPAVATSDLSWPRRHAR